MPFLFFSVIYYVQTTHLLVSTYLEGVIVVSFEHWTTSLRVGGKTLRTEDSHGGAKL